MSEAGKLVSAISQVRSCPAGKVYGKQYPVKVKPSGKTGQLSCLSTFLSKAGSSGYLHEGQERLHKKVRMSEQAIL